MTGRGERLPSLRRTALAGAVAILALGVTSLALLLVLGDGSPAPSSAGPPPGGEPADLPGSASLALLPPSPPPGEPSTPVEPEVTPPAIRSMPRAAATVAWDEVPEAARLYDLGPVLAAPVQRGIQAARAQMDGCFEEEARALARGPSGQDPEAMGPAILVLRLESRQDALDVVDVEVESRGTSTRALVSCAQHVLRGWPIPAEGAAPGKRYRLKWLLQ